MPLWHDRNFLLRARCHQTQSTELRLQLHVIKAFCFPPGAHGMRTDASARLADCCSGSHMWGSGSFAPAPFHPCCTLQLHLCSLKLTARCTSIVRERVRTVHCKLKLMFAAPVMHVEAHFVCHEIQPHLCMQQLQSEGCAVPGRHGHLLVWPEPQHGSRVQVAQDFCVVLPTSWGLGRPAGQMAQTPPQQSTYVQVSLSAWGLQALTTRSEDSTTQPLVTGRPQRLQMHDCTTGCHAPGFWKPPLCELEAMGPGTSRQRLAGMHRRPLRHSNS